MDSSGPRWSGDTRQADWIRARLTAWGGDHVVTVFVPAGFEAYARVLHPVDTPENGGRLVRWADVAAWSGLPLRPESQFHSVALPPIAPADPSPFGGQAPRDGTLYVPDADVLAAIARSWTSTPEDCWFCVWDGFGWPRGSTYAVLSKDGAPPEVVEKPRPNPVPSPVRDGPRLHLPHRDYLIYQGPVEAVTEIARVDGTMDQCANLWWPGDHAWCVATDVDLPWTYVGGPRGLIDAVLADERIEALPAAPGDPVTRVEDWVAAWVDELTDGLLSRGEASVTTSGGTVEARLRRPRRLRSGALFTQVTRQNGGAGSTGETTLTRDENLRESLNLYLTLTVLELAGT